MSSFFVQNYHKGGWTALHYAADGGHLQVSQSLLQGSADVNALNKVNITC